MRQILADRVLIEAGMNDKDKYHEVGIPIYKCCGTKEEEDGKGFLNSEYTKKVLTCSWCKKEFPKENTVTYFCDHCGQWETECKECHQGRDICWFCFGK